ncbi:MAG: hypothetical protein MK052_04800 [Alphaproteobacteria bacterium]|nr:hypothetical protein [Alphaproteobacteria bacterium]
MVSFIAGCFNGMKVDVAPPSCTVDENSPECVTQPHEPIPMENESFFKDEVSAFDWLGSTV